MSTGTLVVPTLRWEAHDGLSYRRNNRLYSGWIGETEVLEDRWCGVAQIVDLQSRLGKAEITVRIGVQYGDGEPGTYAFEERGTYQGMLVQVRNESLEAETKQIVQGLMEQLFEGVHMCGLRVGPAYCSFCGLPGGDCTDRFGSLCAY